MGGETGIVLVTQAADFVFDGRHRSSFEMTNTVQNTRLYNREHHSLHLNLLVHSSLNVQHQVSYPHKTTGKIIFYCVFMFLWSGLECREYGRGDPLS
jgi:hypothetical protein